MSTFIGIHLKFRRVHEHLKHPLWLCNWNLHYNVEYNTSTIEKSLVTNNLYSSQAHMKAGENRTLVVFYLRCIVAVYQYFCIVDILQASWIVVVALGIIMDTTIITFWGKHWNTVCIFRVLVWSSCCAEIQHILYNSCGKYSCCNILLNNGSWDETISKFLLAQHARKSVNFPTLVTPQSFTHLWQPGK